jgi:hypothetical protein
MLSMGVEKKLLLRCRVFNEERFTVFHYIGELVCSGAGVILMMFSQMSCFQCPTSLFVYISRMPLF